VCGRRATGGFPPPARQSRACGASVMTFFPPYLSRRQLLCKLGNGFGALGLASMLAPSVRAATGGDNPLAPKPPHFPPRAKRVIFLFMNGGPSQVDTFDPKPALAKY